MGRQFRTLELYSYQVPAYLNAGARLGACCGNAYCKRQEETVLFEFDDTYKIYPNPAQHVLYLEWLNLETEYVTITLTDLSGRVVKTLFQGMVNQGDLNQVSHSISDLSNGLYLATYSSKSNIRTDKIQIIR